MADAASLASLLGALGIGSVAGQYLAAGGQRRQTRAKVLEALSNTEAARWVGKQKHDPLFPDAMRELETAALIARLPRQAVAEYKVLASAARELSQLEWELFAEDEGAEGGGISADFGEVVRQSAEEISRLAWSPHVGRIFLPDRIKKRREKLEALPDESNRWKETYRRIASYLGP